MKQKDIYEVNLDPTIGFEMKKSRPCVILSPNEMNEHLATVIVAPLTSKERKLPTRVLIKVTKENGLKNDSYVVLDQIRTIDKDRLSKKYGQVSIKESLSIQNVLHEIFTFE